MVARNTHVIPNRMMGKDTSNSMLFVLLLDIWLCMPTYFISL